jgi:predicted ATPase
MLKKITLENFKAFKKMEIEIKPITILIGPNNGGKSSILHSIGLLKQTLGSNTNEILKFFGDTDYGNYSVIRHQNVEADHIRFRFEFEDGTFFDTKINSNNNNEIQITEYSFYDTNFKIKFENIKQIGDKYSYDLHYSYKEFEDLEPIIDFLKEGTLFRENFLLGINYNISDNRKLQPLFRKTLMSLEKREGNVKKSKKNKDTIDEALKIINSILLLQTASYDFNNGIREKFQNIRYIGPLRELAKRYYSIGKYKTVGFKGSSVVQILADNNELFNQTKTVLQKLKVIEDLSIEQKSADENIIELRMKTSITENNVNFADVGCGTSQLLPIIVENLLADNNSLILVEQPETHLHPKIQQELTNILVSSIVNNKNHSKKMIIETHSEYILERIQTLIMNSTIDRDQVKIYYIDQNPKERESKIQEIEIGEDGIFSDYPEGYPLNFVLDESEEQFKLMALKQTGKHQNAKFASQ